LMTDAGDEPRGDPAHVISTGRWSSRDTKSDKC